MASSSPVTLYDANRTAWDQIAIYRPYTAEMAKHFIDFASMETALCYGSSVISKWVKKAGGVSAETDRRAKQWLSLKEKKIDGDKNIFSTRGKVLLVACSDEVAAKAVLILELLGCEVTDV